MGKADSVVLGEYGKSRAEMKFMSMEDGLSKQFSGPKEHFLNGLKENWTEITFLIKQECLKKLMF